MIIDWLIFLSLSQPKESVTQNILNDYIFKCVASIKSTFSYVFKSISLKFCWSIELAAIGLFDLLFLSLGTMIDTICIHPLWLTINFLTSSPNAFINAYLYYYLLIILPICIIKSIIIIHSFYIPSKSICTKNGHSILVVGRKSNCCHVDIFNSNIFAVLFTKLETCPFLIKPFEIDAVSWNRKFPVRVARICKPLCFCF